MDKTKNKLGNYKPNNEIQGHIYDYIDEKVVTPADCYYMGICTTNSEETPIIVKRKSTTEINIKEIDQFVSKLESDLTDIVLKETYTNIPHSDGFVTATGQIQQIGNYYYKKIPVMGGETLYITTNCVGSSGALVVFNDADNQFISNYKVVSEVGAKYYVDEPITAPKGCAYALIHTRNKEEYPIIIKKNIQVIFKYKEFLDFKTYVAQALANNNNAYNETYDKLLFDNQQLEERIMGYEKLLEFDWKPFDKAYVIICIDDGRHDLCKFLEIFKEFNMPLSCALMTSNLNSIQDDKRKLIDVALDIQANGGEVLSHSTSGAVFMETTTEEDANERLRTSKKILTEKGLVINGFVKPGGTGALGRLDKFEHLMRKYYRYGYSAGYSIAYSSGRYDLRGSFENLKVKVDNAIKSKSKITFYSHSFDNDEVTEATLRALLTYIKNTPGVELVTTKYLYDNFATNTVEKRLLALENK